MSEDDAQLEIKKRARRRLVGAAALALGAAIVLPMVMDPEPKAPVQDIQVRIPSQDGTALAPRVLPVKPGATPTPPPDTSAAKRAEVTAGPAGLAKNETAKTAPSKPEPAKAEPNKTEPNKTEPTKGEPAKKDSTGGPATTVATTGGAEKPAEPVADKPATKASSKADKARAEAALNGAEQWVVQLGAYREPARVRNLQAKLKEQGYNFYTEPLVSDGAKLTRVRAGPFPNKDAAEKARERIKRGIGVEGPVARKQ